MTEDQAKTSGTQVDFKIPKWAKKIEITHMSVGSDYITIVMMKLKNHGGIESSEYLPRTEKKSGRTDSKN